MCVPKVKIKRKANYKEKSEMKLKKLSAIIVLLLVTCFGLAACAQNTDANEGSGNNDQEIKKITLAFLPNESTGGDVKENFKHLVTEIQVALGDGYEVGYTVADDYAAVSTAILSGTAQLAWESGNTYATSHLRDENVVPIVSYGPDGKSDEAGYPAYIATHIDNKKDFEGLTDEKGKLAVLKGKSFSFVSPTSTSGCLVPSTSFYKYFGPDGTADIQTREELLTSGKFFSEVQYGQSHQSSVTLINEKKVYAGAYCCGYAQEMGAEDTLYIITESMVPNGPLWANKNYMTDEEMEKIQDHLVNLTPENANSEIFDEVNGLFSAEDVDPEAYMKRFFAVDVEYYDFLYEMNKVK